MDLASVLTKLSGGIVALGGFLLVFGLVNLGLTIKDGMQGGGGQLSGAIAMLVGGGIVIAAGAFFGQIDVSWARKMQKGTTPGSPGHQFALRRAWRGCTPISKEKGGNNMLSVAVHKDIAEYQPKIIGKLTLRTLLCIVCAVGISLIVGLYLYFVLGFDPTDFEVLILAISMPFWAMGFWRPRGMKAETFAKYWTEYNFTRKNISHIPSFKLMGYVERNAERKAVKVYDKEQRKLSKQPGIEAYSPKSGRVL